MVQEVTINWWPVLVAVPMTMVIGALWYSPIAFWKPWLRRIGKDESDFTGAKGMIIGYSVAAFAAFLMAYVVATTLAFAETQNAGEGMLGGFFMWLGLVAAAFAANDFMERRPATLWLINSGYWLIVLLAQGALLGGWQ